MTNLLDLSRIEAGALRADRDVFELDDLVGQTLERCGRDSATGRSRSTLDAPPVDVDPVFLDEALDQRRSRTRSSTRRPDAPIRITRARRTQPGLSG